MAKLKEPDFLPSEAQRLKDRIGKDSALRPRKQCGNCKHQQFHWHAKRSRWFLVVVCGMVCPILCLLHRWRCVHCGVTYTNIPSICVQFKRYLRAEIESRSGVYVETEPTSYRKVVTDEGAAALVYDDPIANEHSTEAEKEAEHVPQMSHSTPHRWISGIAACNERLQPVVKQAQRAEPVGCLSSIIISPLKYRSQARKRVLETCCKLLRAMGIVSLKNPTELETLGSSP